MEALMTDENKFGSDTISPTASARQPFFSGVVAAAQIMRPRRARARVAYAPQGSGVAVADAPQRRASIPRAARINRRARSGTGLAPYLFDPTQWRAASARREGERHIASF